MTDWNLNLNFHPFNGNCDKRVTALRAVNPAASTCKLEMVSGFLGRSVSREVIFRTKFAGFDATLVVINIVK